MNINIKKEVFNDVYLKYIGNEDRYLCFYGGSGSGKSVFIVQRFIYKIIKAERFNLLTIRNVARTNKQSTFALFRQVISKWGLNQYFKINESDLKIKCFNGNEIVFLGLDDSEKIKSITFEKGELTDIWVEEASEIKEADFNQLDIRLRGGNTKKQIVLSFNPISISHWIKTKLIDTKKATVLKTTYKDNKFLDSEYKNVLEGYKKTDEYYYNVYCLGEWGVFGKSIFNTTLINERINKLRDKEHEEIYFKYNYDGLTIYNIKIENEAITPDKIKIFNSPIEKHKYVIGIDTAGSGHDKTAFQVIDNITNEQVARFSSESDNEDEFIRQLYCLAKYYNNALVSIEANFSTYPINELLRLGYDNQYIRENFDTYTNKLQKKYGFYTNKITRANLILEVKKFVNENIDKINDIATLNEMLSFIYNEKGRAEAIEGAHDDLVMSLGIALISRSQQENQIIKEKKKQKINFEFERETNENEGFDYNVV